MADRSVILLGGPDSGKTNYVGRLWHALDAGKGSLVASAQPDDIGFVLDTADHLFEGRFAPRSEHSDGRRDFKVTVAPVAGGEGTKIVIPDIRGELWLNAVAESEISADWMAELKRADGALIFVRVNSDLNVRPLDWVTSRTLLGKLGQDDNRNKLPTQFILCELLRYLELTLANRPDGSCPRVSVVVSAWDIVDSATFNEGPEAYLAKEYPMVAGRLQDTERLDVQIFGLSVVGGDLDSDLAHRETVLENGLDQHGWVATRDAKSGIYRRDPDLTLPVAWVVGT
jgi:hypothetical protein